MSRAARMLELVDHLRASAETTVDTLAAALGVSARTVQRDLATLRDRGFPIVGQAGPGGGVRLEGRRGSAAAHLGVGELVALVLAVRLAPAVGDMPWSRGSAGALTKLLASLSTPRMRELRALGGRIFVGPSASARVRADTVVPPPAHVRMVEEAVARGAALEFRYRDRDGRDSTRRVEAHGFAVTEPVWYLLGRDVDRRAPRMFRLDRMAALAFRPAPAFRPDPGLARSLLPPEVRWEPLLPE